MTEKARGKQRVAMENRRKQRSTARPESSQGRQKMAPRPERKGRTATVPLPMPTVLLDATIAPEVVKTPARTVLAIDGVGPPDSEAFSRSVGAIYGTAYGLKFSRKVRGPTFKIGPLEGRWWAEGVPEGVLQAPRETWRWRLRMAVPDDVGEAELSEVVRAATSKKGGKLEGSEEAKRVFVEHIAQATHGRILHVGPYADEPRSFTQLDATLNAAGLRPAKPHLEVYLSDPRRTAHARLRTVLLREVLT